jgi:hypothetical protein
MSGLRKNVASQKWLVFAFDRTDNTPKTADAAQITAKIRLDYGTATAVTDTNPTEIEDGYYEFDLTQAETNADVLDILPESSTADIQVIGCPARVFTAPAYFADLGIESDGDLTKVNTLHGHTAQTGDTFAQLPTNFSSLGIEVDGDLTKVNTLDGHTAQTADHGAVLGAWTGSGDNTVLGAFKAIMNSSANLPTDIGGTHDPSTDSLEVIANNIAANPGSGAWTYTINVKDTEASPSNLENVQVRLTEGANTFMLETNASGNATPFQLDSATYTVALLKNGYSPSSGNPATIAVSADGTTNLTMDLNSFAAPGAANESTGLMTCFDEENDVENGVTINVQLTAGPGDAGYALDTTVMTATTTARTSDTIDNAAAVDKGDGTVGIPVTAHAFDADEWVTIAGSTNYNGSYQIVSQTTNEVVITETYAAETFAGSETIISTWDDGEVQFPGLIRGATYNCWRGTYSQSNTFGSTTTSGSKVSFTVPEASSFNLPEVLGTD